MTDQPGKDPERPGVQKDYSTLSGIYKEMSLLPGTIIISVNYSLRQQVVVPLPRSYQAAIKIALHQLSEYIDSVLPGQELRNAYFRYRPSKPAYEISEPPWAELPPEYWNIVRDGDMLMLVFRPVSEISRRKKTVKYVELLQDPSNGVRRGSVIIFPRPKSYDVSRLVVQSLFYEDRQMSNISLFMKKESFEQWEEVNPNMRDKDWNAMMERSSGEVEIGVWGR
ncbi:hypothetical protein CPB84DRAFT_1401422 [Gymnopilus junonius]|uniref:Uncharacterized protein n=1 Tax=Gymnopilus junonius TaxID=109634 RepID=A0A9P5NL60_GYMJU|nr:hypothetical protein CPB84DRAFT_1401422 [Gymnopilus junonius]